jgi:hypothetical protein
MEHKIDNDREAYFCCVIAIEVFTQTVIFMSLKTALQVIHTDRIASNFVARHGMTRCNTKIRCSCKQTLNHFRKKGGGG